MKKLNIRLIAALLAALLVLCAAGAAFAVDIDYSGDIDGESFEPADTGSDDTRTVLTSSLYFDWTTHLFVVPVEDSLTEVKSNVADGMVVNEAVNIDSGGDSSVAVFKDGVEQANITNLREPGEYVVSVRKGSTTMRLFDFIIVGDSTNSLQRFICPDSFYIESVTKDGFDAAIADRYVVDMEEEGTYEIAYECGATDIIYRFKTTIDRTPPSLEFTGKIDQQQRVHSALTFSGVEEGDTIILLRDGTEVSPVKQQDGSYKIFDSGNYVLKVFDAAGNEKDYSFQIMVYLNASSWMFILLTLAVIAGVAIYIRIKKKHLKIG